MAKAQQIPVLDGHNDTLLQIGFKHPGSEGTFFTGRAGHLDLEKARAGGLAGGFFAMFVPTRGWKKETVWREVGPDGPRVEKGWDAPLAGGVSQARALNAILSMMAAAFRMEAISRGTFTVVRTHAELKAAMEKGALAAILHMEGVEALKRDLDALHVLHEAGLRSLGPVWSRANIFGHGVPFNFPDTPDIGPGLTDPGRDLVRRCNQLGILVDLSHMNERGFWDVAEATSAPLVATHSGAHALCPSPRNLTDEQLKAIGASGGVVGVNFARAFLRSDGLGDRVTSLTEIVRHVTYIAETIGEDHVAFGSDFDGTQVPQDLSDASGLQKLVRELEDRGAGEEAIRKIAHGNWLRVLRETWKE